MPDTVNAENVELEVAKRRREFLTALRSGNYTQGRGALLSFGYVDDELINENSFCCIGVGCHIAGFKPIQESANLFLHYDDASGYDFFRSHYEVEFPVTETLMNMNDGDDMENNPGRTFSEIADYLEMLWFGEVTTQR